MCDFIKISILNKINHKNKSFNSFITGKYRLSLLFTFEVIKLKP